MPEDTEKQCPVCGQEYKYKYNLDSSNTDTLIEEMRDDVVHHSDGTVYAHDEDRLSQNAYASVTAKDWEPGGSN